MVDETGFLKKGDKSAGVHRQYTGTAGRIENCQVGVFLAYATRHGHAFLDRELYVPKEWCDDRPRCQAAGIPDTVTFHTKPLLAREMLARAFDAGVPAAWVTGDEVYGGSRTLRIWLEERGHPFVLAVRSNEALFHYDTTGLRQRRAAKIAASLPADAWQVLSAGEGSKGPREYRWAWTDLFRIGWPGWRHALLVRERLTPDEHGKYERAYYVVFAPRRVTLPELVRVAGTRWGIEQAFEEAKQEVGLDEYEVRKYAGWYRYVTLALFAHAFLAVVRARAAPREKGTRAGRPARRRSSR